jgi:hypothetical protein
MVGRELMRWVYVWVGLSAGCEGRRNARGSTEDASAMASERPVMRLLHSAPPAPIITNFPLL